MANVSIRHAPLGDVVQRLFLLGSARSWLEPCLSGGFQGQRCEQLAHGLMPLAFAGRVCTFVSARKLHTGTKARSGLRRRLCGAACSMPYWRLSHTGGQAACGLARALLAQRTLQGRVIHRRGSDEAHRWRLFGKPPAFCACPRQLLLHSWPEISPLPKQAERATSAGFARASTSKRHGSLVSLPRVRSVPASDRAATEARRCNANTAN
jgi:hypothetical protein